MSTRGRTCTPRALQIERGAQGNQMLWNKFCTSSLWAEDILVPICVRQEVTQRHRSQEITKDRQETLQKPVIMPAAEASCRNTQSCVRRLASEIWTLKSLCGGTSNKTFLCGPHFLSWRRQKSTALPYKSKKDILLPSLKSSMALLHLWFWITQRWIFLSLGQEEYSVCLSHSSCNSRKSFIPDFSYSI